MALSLLGNIATLPEILQVISASSSAGGQPAVVTVTKLLASQDSDVKVKAATLLGNLCHDSSVRAQVCHVCSPTLGAMIGVEGAAWGWGGGGRVGGRDV